MRKYIGKPLSIVLDTIILHTEITCEQVISPQFSQTKQWPKLNVVGFGRFGLSYSVDNTPIYFPKSEI